MSLKEQIKTKAAENGPPREKFTVAAWECEVWVVGLSGGERDAFEASRLEGKGKRQKTSLVNFRGALLSRVLHDESGNRIFDDADAEWIGQQPVLVIEDLFEAAMRLSAFRQADVEELEKN